MTHLGSAKELGEKEALKKVVAGIKKILEDYTGSTQFLIEMSAGAGMIIGDSFEEISLIIKNLKLKNKNSVGVCFDTAHGFASGYDLRDQKAVKKTFDDFDKLIGLKRLKLMHVNDSMVELGSHRDRHQNIGEGKIGHQGFEALVKEPRLENINLILETPDKDKDQLNIKILKDFRNKK